MGRIDRQRPAATDQHGHRADRVGDEDRLRRLVVHGIGGHRGAAHGSSTLASLQPRSLALARLAALVAVRGSVASYGELADAAVDAGATPSDCIDVLEGIIDLVGLPTALEAASRLALALGYDVDDLS